MLLAGVLAAAEQRTRQVTAAATPSVLLVGSWHGRPGQFTMISAAVATAKPCDWILVGPGDYNENPGQETAVRITTPDVHLRGMNRNQVVVDGTRPNAGLRSFNVSQSRDLGDQSFSDGGETGVDSGRRRVGGNVSGRRTSRCPAGCGVGRNVTVGIMSVTAPAPGQSFRQALLDWRVEEVGEV
jgi:hypothetical protein